MKLPQVVHLNHFDENVKVFCKKKDRVVTLDNSQTHDCSSCQYLFGLLQGAGVECQWPDECDYDAINVKDPYKECRRVRSLIKKGKLKKG